MKVFAFSYETEATGSHFSERFRACVERSGKTHKEIAEVIGLSANHVGRICRGGGSDGI